MATEKTNENEAAVLAVGAVRRTLVELGDIRNEVGFQNDINLMLSTLENGSAPWVSAAPLFAPMKPAAPRPAPVRNVSQESRTGKHRNITLPRIDLRALEAQSAG